MGDINVCSGHGDWRVRGEIFVLTLPSILFYFYVYHGGGGKGK